MTGVPFNRTPKLPQSHLMIGPSDLDMMLIEAAKMVPRPRDTVNLTKWDDWRKEVAFVAVQLLKTRVDIHSAIEKEKANGRT